MTTTDAEAPTLTYYRTAERPALELWWPDADGSLIDFSTGYDFELKLARGVVTAVSVAAFTKVAGITGDAGSGTETSGTPNVTVEFTADELNDLAAGIYTWQLRATTPAGLDRFSQCWFQLLDVIP